MKTGWPGWRPPGRIWVAMDSGPSASSRWPARQPPPSRHPNAFVRRDTGCFPYYYCEFSASTFALVPNTDFYSVKRHFVLDFLNGFDRIHLCLTLGDQ
jgi:hypothetical protein